MKSETLDGYIIVHTLWDSPPEEYLRENGSLSLNPLEAWLFESAEEAQLRCEENETVKHMSIEYTIQEI